MNAQQALKLDNRNSFYVEFDNDCDMWGVFGCESGFCYSLHTDEYSANKALHGIEEMKSKNEVVAS